MRTEKHSFEAAQYAAVGCLYSSRSTVAGFEAAYQHKCRSCGFLHRVGYIFEVILLQNLPETNSVTLNVEAARFSEVSG
jgi:hypothetical protein